VILGEENRMRLQNKLFLHEEITLLTLRDKEGTFQIGATYDYAIGGAVLAELLLNERVVVEETRRKKLANLISSKPLGDPIIDECLQKVRCAKRRATLQTWVARFARVKRLRLRIGEQMCRRGILRADEDKILWIFTRRVYPEVDPVPERQLIDRMRKGIFTDRQDIDPRTVILISLAKSAGLLNVVFDKKKLRSRKGRIERIINGEVTGTATNEAIATMRAAIFLVCITSAGVATRAGR
jgi:Golgi phosphoprotein 3